MLLFCCGSPYKHIYWFLTILKYIIIIINTISIIIRSLSRVMSQSFKLSHACAEAPSELNKMDIFYTVSNYMGLF